MNIKIKAVIVLLILSAICPFIATQTSEYLKNDSTTLMIDFVWVGVIIWMISDLLKQRSITGTLFILTGICFYFSYETYQDYGLVTQVYFELAEAVLLLISSVILLTIDKAHWKKG